MYCPNCGSEAPMEQKFCRSCGFGLGKVAQLIVEQAPDENLEPGSGPGEERLKMMSRLWTAGLGVFIGAFLFSIIWVIIDKLIIGKGHVWQGLGFIVFLLGVVALGLSGIYIESLREKLSQRKSRKPSPSIGAPATDKILSEPGIEMSASVTEQTTAKLAERIEN